MNRFTWFKSTPDVTISSLYDENNFYQAFINDLKMSKKEVIIESPFITPSRMDKLIPIFQDLLSRGIKIYIITRNPIEHNEDFRYHTTEEILRCSELGVKFILEKGNHHRKLAIIDKAILWEGSLNILSQSYSKEIMRRIESKYITEELIKFLKLVTIY